MGDTRGVVATPTARQRSALGAGLVVVSCLAIQGSAAASSGLFSDMGAVGVAAWRQVFGAAALLLLFRPTVRGRPPSVWLVIAVLGASMAAMNTTYYLTIERLPLGVSAALLYLGPFVVAIAGIRRRWLLVWPCLALAGVLAITRPDQAAGLPATGIGFGLLAAVALASYTVASHRLGARAAVADVALAISFSALLLSPVAVAHPPQLSVRTLGTLALVGSLGVALAFTCDFLALRLAGTTIVGTLFALDPVVGALVGLALLGQGLPLGAALGVTAISLAGIGLAGRMTDYPVRVVESCDTGTRQREDVSTTELVGGVEQRDLFLVDHDPAWVDGYAVHEARVRGALGDLVVSVEHIGSTSVPGLAAKPIIDVLLTVPDITAEEDYLEPLLACGYVLRVREPGHRLVRTEQRDVHVHILEPGDPAARDHLLLRDHLRVDPDDRHLYESTKRELVRHEWSDMNEYADAKTAVIEDIKGRARSTTEGRWDTFDGVKVGRPATGALIDAGYTCLEELPADLDILGGLHGVGPDAVERLRSARG